MRIAFISTMAGAPWGGSEALWSAAAHRAMESGHAVLINTFDHTPPPPPLAALEARGAQIVTRPRRVSRFASLVGAPTWLAEVQRFGPDVVCLSQGAPFEAVVRRSTRPIARWVVQSSIPFVNVVQFAHEQEHLRGSPQRRARDLYRAAAINAFVADRNRAVVERALGTTLPAHCTVVLRNPVNLADLSALPWPDGPIRFACVGRLFAKTKGQDTLLRVLASDAWRGRDWRLTLAGEGPDRAMLEHLAASLGLADRVHFAGQVSDLRALWRDHHALVLPSRAEGTPLAMVEAMLLGRVCITSDVGGCREWLGEDAAGPGFVGGPEAGDLSAALERAWARRDDWPMLGAALRQRALGLIDPDPGATLLKLLERAATAGGRA